MCPGSSLLNLELLESSTANDGICSEVSTSGFANRFGINRLRLQLGYSFHLIDSGMAFAGEIFELLAGKG
jgi:hypothetical protein